jgi:hypothetical protein
MNCAVHTDVENVAFCIRCGKALCAECMRSVKGSVYCEPCLSDILAGVGASPRKDAGPATEPSKSAESSKVDPPSPEAAFVLGLIPGVGAICNGELIKAAIHVLIFGLLLSIADEVGSGGPLFGMMAAGFYFYMPFDAYYTAKKRRMRAQGIELTTPLDGLYEQLGSAQDRHLFGGVGLIVAGSILLLSNFKLFNFDIGRLWPVMLVLFGIWLLKRHQEKAG